MPFGLITRKKEAVDRIREEAKKEAEELKMKE